MTGRAGSPSRHRSGSAVSESSHQSRQSIPGAYEEESTAIQDDGKGKEPARGWKKKIGKNEYDLEDIEDIQRLYQAAVNYREYYVQLKQQAGGYAHKLLQAQEEVAILQNQLENQPAYPALPNDDAQPITEQLQESQATVEQLRTENNQLREKLEEAHHRPFKDAT